MKSFYLLAGGFMWPAFISAQFTIALQDFESQPESPTWQYSFTGGSSAGTNSGTPANSRIRSGLSSFQLANLSSQIDFSAVTVSGFNGVQVLVNLSSISVTTGNGADGADYVRLFVSIDGAEFPANLEALSDIAVNGNANSRWGYSSSGPLTVAGTHITVTGTAGTNAGTVHSSLRINIPDGSETVALRLIMQNNDANEVWCVDDIMLVGTPVILPVHFVNTHAIELGSANQLSWTNMNETGVEYYYVERRSGDEAFRVLATIAARGNQGMAVHYRWEDRHPSMGANYYRIIAVENDGFRSYSKVMIIQRDQLNARLQIYPNPVIGARLCWRHGNLPKGNYKMQIIDSRGLTIIEMRFPHHGGATSREIRLPGTNKGIHMMILENEQQRFVLRFLSE